MRIETITTVLDLIGVFINALLGGSVARRRELDLFGYVVIGTVSGLGGGLIRDVLLQHGPPLALTNPLYIPIALAGAGLAFVVKFSEQDWTRLFYVLDAIALCVWAAAGAQRTLEAGFSWLPAILLGTTTAVGGGATRDLLVQRVPAVFGGNGLYASVAVLVAAVQVMCSALGASTVVGTALGVSAGVILRLIAYRRGWNLPRGAERKPRDVIGKITHPPLPGRRRRDKKPGPDGRTD
ncbi:trimeric intracellular cation channel family protein [Streptosporangium canum]|uniref:trimeric intracellular cation channel family protein n=1 Tax=Streptosporangium canum TaxID=324952 RepID=UPI003683E99B